jgi:hypothetical protein
LTSTVLIWAGPTLKEEVTVRRPQTPEESSTPPMAAVTLTVVPLGQYDAGRHWTSVALIHRHAPLTAGLDVTVRAFSAASWYVTGDAKVTTTGIPTPTVQSSPGTSVTRLYALGVKVVKVEVVLVVPDGLFVVTCTV